MNRQAGTEAKTARKKLGLWPRLWALGNIQLDGAVQAGPDVESHRVAGDSLTAGERDKEQTDMTIQRVKYCHLGNTGALVSQERNPIHWEGAERLLGRGNPCVLRPQN